MFKIARALLVIMLSCTIPLAHAEEESTGELIGIPQPEQLRQIEVLQRRTDKLALGELGANNYHLAKARTWLDMALSEYYENEGNGIVPSAIEQAQILLDALEKKQADSTRPGVTPDLSSGIPDIPVDIPMDTPQQLTGSEPVRPDLWDKIASLKKHEQFSCAQRPIAEAEVHLVWAGHEKAEASWVNADSYENNAENLIKEGIASINNCVAQVHAIEKITLSSDTLFEFGKANLESSVLWRLNNLVDSIKAAEAIEEIDLIGHTDRLRGDGHFERNQLLSEQRAESIKQFLTDKGIPADKIRTSGAGSSQPLVECSDKRSKAKQIECLRPNRRVEIILRGTKQDQKTTQYANPVPTTRN